MKLQFYSSGLGSNTFLSRLSKYLVANHGVEVVKEGPDIYLSSVWRGKPPKGAKKIHRVDGVYFDKNFRGAGPLNDSIERAINKADGVVFQSTYSLNMCRGILHMRKHLNHTIIYNGFDPSIYDNIVVDKMGYDYMFVACAKWRSLKRPRSIANGFLAAAIPKSILIMIGEISVKHKVKHPSIKYVGPQKGDKLFQYYKSCDALIHIGKVDACPNVVVEALAAGKPVVCNNIGGTPEIVQESGIKIDIDEPLKYKKFALNNPDCVSPKLIANGIIQCIEKKWDIKRDDLSMKTCADKYMEFFGKV